MRMRKFNLTKGQLAMQVSLAAASGELEGVRRAIKLGADVNAVIDRSKRTPLMAAARENQPEIVEFLLKKGANPMLKDADGRIAFHYASEVVESAIRSQILLRVAVSKRIGDKWKAFVSWKN